MSISILQHTQGIEGYQLLRCDYSPVFTAHLSKKPGKFKCSACHSFDVTATATGTRVIKALPMGIKQTKLSVRMHRIKCHSCKAYRMEDIQFISSPSSRVSRQLERTIIALRKHMSISAIASYFELHWETVKNIEKKTRPKI